ncbi:MULTISPECIES: elongation factor P [Thermovenabulum]|uniref:Elongation factor P n=1 Tax=Thermovenabulum gondwanense TaxID=520767 RepID=A0A162MGZ1_9FIRM|nr:elongation factor P [Thermovenabulum gondwanense]KYO65829.1 Elongation factor P [Thermovenabulum gondwanense]
MISTNDLRPGVTVEIDGEVYVVVEFQHVKPGKGAAFVRTKIKNVKTGQVFERNFRAGEKLNRAILERKNMQYLYETDGTYYFMDTQTYEQVPLTKEQLGDALKFLKENLEVMVVFYEGKAIGIELPTFVDLKVVETEPGFRGDTATGGSKPATLETGAVVQVPLFVEIGDVVRIDTRTGEYLSRV